MDFAVYAPPKQKTPPFFDVIFAYSGEYKLIF